MGACGVTIIDGESNESIYSRFGMSHKGIEKKCGVVEEVKRGTLRWFGHLERMGEEKMTKRVYKSDINAVGVRGRPLVRWDDRVLEYVRERGDRRVRSMQQARRECMDRDRWRLFCRGHPLGGVPGNKRWI